jgi:hypothetical protein
MKLNLPKNPLVDPVAVSSRLITNGRLAAGGYDLVEPGEVLTDEIMDIFSDLKLKPKFVTLFGSGANRRTSTVNDRMIHTDIQQLPDLTWKKMLFGINWEIGDAENIFSWYDMSKLPEVYPGVVVPSKFRTLGGIHYIRRFNPGIPEGAVTLDQTTLTFGSGPTLVRTNVAHLTVYKSKLLPRVGVSVRFDESDFDTWEDVTAFMGAIKQ